MSRLKQKILIISAILVSSIFIMPALTSYALDCSNPATAQDQIQCGANTAAGSNGSGDAGKTLNNTVAEIINILSLAAGIIAVIVIIVGGLRYVTSAGNPEQAKSARNTIVYAVIGLVIVVLAQLIVHFVLKRTTNAVSMGFGGLT